MAEPIRLPFGTGSDTGRHGPDAGPRHWNAYVEAVDEGKHPAPIHADDGFDLFSTITDGGATRGMIVMGSNLYAVSGTILVKVDAAGTATTIGGIPGTSKVSMAHNDKTGSRQLVICVDGNKYLCEGDVLSDITDADLPAATSCTFLNQRIIYGIADGRFFWSGLDSASSIDVLDFATAEGRPDGLVAVREHLQQVWVFGGTSIEPWIDTGNSSAPFRRSQGSVIPKGCIGRDTIAALDKDLFWVGDDGSVYMAQGYDFQRISNHGAEQDILATEDKSTIEALTFFMGGHGFYVLSAADWSWAFNRTTQKWHERFSYGLDRWRGSHAVDFNGKIIVGDYSTNKLYQISRSAYDEAGTNMVWRVRCAPVHAYPQRMSHYRLHCDFVLGVGLNVVPGNDSFTKVLLHFNGVDASTSIVDANAGGSSHTWTANGDAQIDTAQSKFGGASLLCDGTGDYVSTPDHADYTLGSNDFTVDCWFNCTAPSGGFEAICGQRSSAATADTSIIVFRVTTGEMSVQVGVGAVSSVVTGTTQFTDVLNIGWHHLAIVRTGNVLKMFIDGVQEGGNTALTGSVNDIASVWSVGNLSAETNVWTGWIDEFRLSVGTARWTANFTPPTRPYSNSTEAQHLTAPQVGLRWSDDGGYSWSNQLTRSLGAIGVRHVPVVWDQLGDTGHTGRIYELEISSPVVRTLMYAAVEADVIGT